MLDYILAPLIAGGIEIMGLILLCSLLISYLFIDTFLKIQSENQAFAWFKQAGGYLKASTKKTSLLLPLFQEIKQFCDDETYIKGLDKKVNCVMPNIERRLKVAEAIVQSAPLLGLLGTVSGMIMTFDALRAHGNEQGMLAEGIARALYTTEFGLLVAIPGVFFSFVLQQKIDILKRECHSLSLFDANQIRSEKPS